MVQQLGNGCCHIVRVSRVIQMTPARTYWTGGARWHASTECSRLMPASVQQTDAGLKVKLAYRFGPRMMKRLTGREPQTGSGIEPMEIWAHQPKM